jgi:NitT/TauT family transport system substrate-binding protein
VYPVYLNEEPVTAINARIKIIEIDPSSPENGSIRMYGNVIIAHQDFIEKHPEYVRGFVKALRRGWEYAKNNGHETEKILRSIDGFNTPQMPEVLKRSIGFATYSYAGVEVPPGHMDTSGWEETLKLLKEGGVIKKEIDVNKFTWMNSQ